MFKHSYLLLQSLITSLMLLSLSGLGFWFGRFKLSQIDMASLSVKSSQSDVLLGIQQSTDSKGQQLSENTEPAIDDQESIANTIKTTTISLNKTGTQWAPHLEWSLSNPSYDGNPFDLIATATFIHSASGETRTTQMFYDGNNVWKFRFTATKTGKWTVNTSSSDPDLSDHSGTITIVSNSNESLPGFVTNFEEKWIKSATNQAFVPNFVMYTGPQGYYDQELKIDQDIQTFIKEHGFTGFHTPVFCRWFEINTKACSNISLPKSGDNLSPDRKTFEALELLITKVHAAGGIVHIWVWGDSSRKQNSRHLPGGLNGVVDKRLQRYIAARLGPLPGWTMGYGFDLWEWVDANNNGDFEELDEWHNYMHSHFGWDHYLGARGKKDGITQLSNKLDYSGYEQIKPSYDDMVKIIDDLPTKPTFTEDRFRVKTKGIPSRNFTMDEVRRTMWNATMAGGTAAIWGYAIGGNLDDINTGDAPSLPFSNPEQIKIYQKFFQHRFTTNLERCNSLTNGVCLKSPDNSRYVFYIEDSSTIEMDLTEAPGSQSAIAVNTKNNAYIEIDLGKFSADNHVWTTPYSSDWAIAVGNFNNSAKPPPAHTPTSRNPLLDEFVYLPTIMKSGP